MLNIIAVIAVGALVVFSRAGLGAELARDPLLDRATVSAIVQSPQLHP
jgi:hypothetical protein